MATNKTIRFGEYTATQILRDALRRRGLKDEVTDVVREDFIASCFLESTREKKSLNQNRTSGRNRNENSSTAPQADLYSRIAMALEELGLPECGKDTFRNVESTDFACRYVTDYLPIIVVGNLRDWSDQAFIYVIDKTFWKRLIAETEESKQVVVSDFIDVIKDWQENSDRYLQEIEGAIRKVDKRHKVAKMGETTRTAIIAMRMEQEGFAYLIEERPKTTILRIRLARQKYISFTLQHSDFTSQLDSAVSVARRMNGAAKSNDSDVKITESENTMYMNWKGANEL